MKKTILLNSILIALSLLVTTATFAQKKDKKDKKTDKVNFLEGKKYVVKFYELKPTGRGKALESTIVFKDGRIDCELMDDKLKIEKTKYEVTLDSTYTEDETTSHLVKLEATFTVGKDESQWEATITNYDIEGTIQEKKNGVDKKKFEFNGSEKTKK